MSRYYPVASGRCLIVVYPRTGFARPALQLARLPSRIFQPVYPRAQRSRIGAISLENAIGAIIFRGHRKGLRLRGCRMSAPPRCRGITATAPASGERRVAGAGTANAVFAPPKTECSAPKRPTDPGFRTPLRKTHLIDHDTGRRRREPPGGLAPIRSVFSRRYWFAAGLSFPRSVRW
jgi:hypothetical protein